MSPNLAWWHTYKHAAQQCWWGFLDVVWAPLFHCLYPGNSINPKNKGVSLPLVLAHMQFVRLAYPSFREHLQKVLTFSGLTPAMRVAALDLQCLCEFFIPTVMFYTFQHFCQIGDGLFVCLWTDVIESSGDAANTFQLILIEIQFERHNVPGVGLWPGIESQQR